MFAFTDTRGPIGVAFTDRHGGVSAAPYAALNLGLPSAPPDDLVGDHDRFVTERAANLERVRLGLAEIAPAPRSLALMRQVHGAHVVVLDAPAMAAQEEAEDLDGRRVADGLVTGLAGVGLVVRSADCVPVVLADPEAGIVGAAHAGRQGLVAGIVPETVRALRAAGATELVAWIGPYVCGGCYEVPEQMRAQVSTAVPAAFAETTWGTPSVDLGAGVRTQLEAGGIEVVDVARCTREDPDLYSHRRDGRRSGRAAGIVWVGR